MKKKLVFVISVFLIGMIAYTIQYQQSNSIVPVPDVTFTSITGKKIDLRKLKGHPIIITFWATDCASCIKEIPHLISLYQKYHHKGLEIIAVAMYYDLPNHVVEMTKATQIPYDVALDLKAEHATAFGNVKLTPTTFLFSPSGKMEIKKTGVFSMLQFTTLLDKFTQ